VSLKNQETIKRCCGKYSLYERLDRNCRRVSGSFFVTWREENGHIAAKRLVPTPPSGSMFKKPTQCTSLSL
jgi:hypothetical protein